MKIFYLVLFLTEAIVQFQIVNSIQSPPISRIDHLPKDVIPEFYDLEFYLDHPTQIIPFRGQVKIRISCKIDTDVIILNVKELKILDDSVTVAPSDKPESPIEIKSRDPVPLKDQYVITLVEKLQADQTYEVFMLFEKKSLVDLSDRGLIRYAYRKGPGKPKNTITLTRTEINDARRYFPCMEQMSMKAKFRIRITYPSHIHMRGFGSTKFLTGSLAINIDGGRMGEFDESDPISTHSLSLVLLTNFMAKKNIVDSKGATIMIWSDDEISNDPSTRLDFISEKSADVLHHYLDYFESDSPVRNLNILGLPKFHETNTEKSGMIFLEESTLSSTEILDEVQKADILLQLCFEICRQWIGASVTMMEWNEYWAQRALATLLRDHCFNELNREKSSNLVAWDLVESFIHVLKFDGESVSRPVHVNEENFDLTEAFSDSVLSEKANILIRTMNYIFRKEDFQDGVKKYYRKFKNDNSSLDELWGTFNEIAKEKSNIYPNNPTINKIMDSWSRKKGYPVVTMTMIQEEKKTYIRLTQKRFVQLEDEENKIKTVGEHDHWIIPLNSVTKSQLLKNKEMTEIVAEVWLLTDQPVSFLYTGEWILLNLHMNVLCRVNYPQEIWNLLVRTLMDETEYFLIDELSRVQLIVDMFALAEVDEFPYESLMTAMFYVRHEYSDLVLMVALQELNRIRLALYGSLVLTRWENYMREILEPIFDRRQFKIIDELPQYNRRELELKKLVIELSCNVGVDSCIQQAETLFYKYVTSDKLEKDNKIPMDIRKTVYSHGIKRSGRKKWDLLYKKYAKQNPEDVNKAILFALGCTTDVATLTHYLHIFDDDVFPPHYHLPIISGLASNEVGYKELKAFFISKINLDNIDKFDGYENTIGFFLVELFKYANTETDFNVLKGTMDSIKGYLTGVESLLRENIRIANRNFLWRAKHERSLSILFKIMFPDTA